MLQRKPLLEIGVLKRRGLLAGFAGLGVASTFPGIGAMAKVHMEPSDYDKRTYLLVHGAWHGGWCWRDVRSSLEDAGHTVLTPTLTGLAERKHLLSASVGLDTHIADITGLIDYYDLRDVVLVGHSYGGMVITGVADARKDHISHIVYLDAALPKDGQTMISQGEPLGAEAIAAAERQMREMASDGMAMDVLPAELLGIPKEHPGHAWVAEKMTPHPLKSWFDPIRLVNGGSAGLKRTYIHCNDPVLERSSFPWHARQVQTEASWNYHPLATGHDAMVTAPQALTELLLCT